ncbi:MAG TPA: TetR/AcrR family transcriptional regulator [Pilimelia sp.]|nr:TetR/AcrR family transcriptional regulator [Pilimelia sp.]
MARAVRSDQTALAQRYLDAGLAVLRDDGPAELTVRRIAEAAGSSTMGIYSRFGGRTGILEALYRRGMQMLTADLTAGRDAAGPRAAGPPADGRAEVLGIISAYRRFALANPTLYAFLFERPVPDFDPDPALRSEALEAAFGLLVAAVRGAALDPGRDVTEAAYLVWTTAHGLISLELTHTARRPLPGWFLATDEAWQRIFDDGVTALLNGLARPAR